MAEPESPPPQRVSPITVPEEDPALPAPGESQPALVRDAFREFRFACSGESGWIERSLTLQRDIVRASRGSRYRNHRYTAALLLWSRIDAVALETWRLIAWANYAAVPPLIRAALEWLGAEQAIVGSEFEEFEAYLRDFAQHDAEHVAVELGMGQYMAGQQLAMAAELGNVYRAAAELARPHFGASMLVTASESNRQRVLVHWGDRAFHLGWAQLLSGWLMVLLGRQSRFAVGTGPVRRGRGAAGVVPGAHATGGDDPGGAGSLPGGVGDEEGPATTVDQRLPASAVGGAASIALVGGCPCSAAVVARVFGRGTLAGCLVLSARWLAPG